MSTKFRREDIELMVNSNNIDLIMQILDAQGEHIDALNLVIETQKLFNDRLNITNKKK